MHVIGEAHETKSGFKWKINNFWCLSEKWYRSPSFIYNNDSWYLEIWPNSTNYFDSDVDLYYVDLCLIKETGDSPISVEISLALESVNGENNLEKHFTEVFVDEYEEHEFKQFISRSELVKRKSEFLLLDVLTVVCSLKISKSIGSASDIATLECSYCKDTFEAEIISSHEKKCIDKPIKCPECSTVIPLHNWYEHQCQTSETEGDTTTEMCYCCKEHLGAKFISLHEKCINRPMKYPYYFNHELFQNRLYDQKFDKEGTEGESNKSVFPVVHPKNKILHDLNQLFLSQEHCDVVLRVKEWEFSAHKAILTARSPVFASTFRNDMKEKELGIVVIEDCDPFSFSDFLRFLYCEDVDSFSLRNVFSLYRTADKYDVPDLKTKCVEFMKYNLSVDTFCETLSLALLHTETDLIQSTTNFFINNIEEILETVKWQSFAAENPTYNNELVIKYVKYVKHSNK